MNKLTRHIRTYFAIFLATFIFTQLAGAAHAATETLSSVRLDPLMVNLIIAAIIPILTGLFTKANWSKGTKGLLTLVLTAVQTLIVQNVTPDGGAFLSKEVLLAFALSFVISIATYYGAYKPFGITSSPTMVRTSVGDVVVEEGKLAGVGIK